jgi:long-subunit acyl-CoA synthetase (AMP-forming)
MGLGMKQPIALVVLGEGKDRFDKSIQQDILATLTQVNTELESHQRLDYIFICAESWTCENELLTPTLKLKRDSIEQYYLKLLPEVIEDQVIVQM